MNKERIIVVYDVFMSKNKDELNGKVDGFENSMRNFKVVVVYVDEAVYLLKIQGCM